MSDMKTEVPGFYKSSDGVIINKDKKALEAYREKKKREMEFNRVKNEVDSIKNDLSEIKELLKGLVK